MSSSIPVETEWEYLALVGLHTISGRPVLLCQSSDDSVIWQICFAPEDVTALGSYLDQFKNWQINPLEYERVYVPVLTASRSLFVAQAWKDAPSPTPVAK